MSSSGGFFLLEVLSLSLVRRTTFLVLPGVRHSGSSSCSATIRFLFAPFWGSEEVEGLGEEGVLEWFGPVGVSRRDVVCAWGVIVLVLLSPPVAHESQAPEIVDIQVSASCTKSDVASDR